MSKNKCMRLKCELQTEDGGRTWVVTLINSLSNPIGNKFLDPEKFKDMILAQVVPEWQIRR